MSQHSDFTSTTIPMMGELAERHARGRFRRGLVKVVAVLALVAVLGGLFTLLYRWRMTESWGLAAVFGYVSATLTALGTWLRQSVSAYRGGGET